MTPNPPTVELEDEAWQARRDDDLSEFVDGRYVEKNMGAESGMIWMRLAIRVGAVVLANKLGEMFDANTPCQCFPKDPTKVRKPDTLFISTGRLPATMPKGNLKIAPDLAVEVISPTDKARRSRRKWRTIAARA